MSLTSNGSFHLVSNTERSVVEVQQQLTYQMLLQQTEVDQSRIIIYRFYYYLLQGLRGDQIWLESINFDGHSQGSLCYSIDSKLTERLQMVKWLGISRNYFADCLTLDFSFLTLEHRIELSFKFPSPQFVLILHKRPQQLAYREKLVL